jgi:predicted outer membrane repeat protein
LSRFGRHWPPKSGRGPVNLTILGNVSFVGNIAGDNGGAIYATGEREFNRVSMVAHLDVGGAAIFSNNNALGSYGGAVSIERAGTLAIHGDVRFQGNMGITEGGAVHVHRSEAHISGKVVMNSNYAPWGGALYAYASVIRLSGEVTLSNNSAQTAGGGIGAASDSAIMLVDDVVVHRSTAPIGGAIYLDSSDLTVAGRARLSDNNAGIGGMAYLINSVSANITDSARIENNQADSEGGGFFVAGSSLDMRGMAVVGGNRAGGSGGAIAARASASVWVGGDAAVVENEARSAGGAIDADTSVNLWLVGSSSIRSNRASSGGGLSLRSESDIFIYNFTVEMRNPR